jgi:hypothetical protein
MKEVKSKASGLAKGSIACGICTIIPFAGFAFSLAAIIMGIVDLVKIKNGKSGVTGKKLDITGIVLAVILLPASLVLFWIFTGIIMAAGNSSIWSEIGTSLSSIVSSLIKLVKIKLGFFK